MRQEDRISRLFHSQPPLVQAGELVMDIGNAGGFLSLAALGGGALTVITLVIRRHSGGSFVEGFALRF